MTNTAAQQWIWTTSAYTLCINTSSPCGLWLPAGPSLHFENWALLGTPSPSFSIFAGSSSQTGSSSGRRKMESSVWERVELLSLRVMIPLMMEVIQILSSKTSLTNLPFATLYCKIRRKHKLMTRLC